MAEHGSGETKEAQTLLSKKDKIFNLKQRGKILYQSQDNFAISLRLLILRQNFSHSADFQCLLSNESSKDYSKINRKKDQFLFVKRTEITFMCGAVKMAIDIKKIASNLSRLPLKIINKIAIIKKEKPLVNHDFR
jgi:hypothetical protein